MPVLYDGKKLIPAPFATISEDFIKDGTGQIIGATYGITLIGKFVAWKGSPTSSGTWWTNTGYPPDESIVQNSRLAAILHKQESLMSLFSNQGKTLEIQPWDGTAPLKCNPQIVNINFPDGIWTEYCDYTITMVANQIYGYIIPSGLPGTVTDVTNQWQIDLGDSNNYIENSSNQTSTFRVTHTVGAKGLLQYDINGNIPKKPWEYAKEWVLTKAGYDSNRVSSSSVLNVPMYLSNYNWVRSEATDEFAGTFQLNESWILSSGNVIEDFTVNTQTSVDTGLTRVSINGTVQGLETRDANYQISQTKFAAASGKFPTIQSNLLTRAQTFSNTTLNTTPLTQDIGKNILAGTISYNYEYDNRPSNLIPGTRQEMITVVDNYPSDIFAAQTVLGRANGRLLQDLETTSESSRQLTIDIVVQPSSTLSISDLINNPFISGPSATTVNNIIDGVRPVANFVFVETPQVTWNPKTGQGSYNITWVYSN